MLPLRNFLRSQVRQIRAISPSPTISTARMSSIANALSEEPVTKRAKTSKVIGTHSGTFHCDEALAVYLLRHTAQYRDADLKRSRDPAVLDTCDIVVDVGAVYDESKQRFDHHQREFNDSFGHGFVTRLSSAGLVYKHFGRDIIASRFELSPEDPKVETLWLKLYKEFIEAIDAIDNGIGQYGKDAKPLYRSRTDLSSRVGHLNPAWNEVSNDNVLDSQFAKASKLAGDEFMGRLDYYGKAWLPARDLVSQALAARFNADESGKIILFESFLPWKEHLFELEAEHGIPKEHAEPIYVVYPDESGKWRIQAVPVTPESFESRKALPDPWRGLRDDALSEKTGIPGGIFVHASGFIGGNATKEGALSMAKLALTL